MIRRSIKQLSTMIHMNGPIEQYADVSVHGISTDSRNIQPGSLFVPLMGKHVDGHDYVGHALANGAAASLWKIGTPPPDNLPVFLVEDPLVALQELAKSYRKQVPVQVVGITGSNGKTSTKDILASILRVKYRVQKTTGNLNNELGVPLTILSLEEDTEIAIVEMAMRGLRQIALLTEIAQPNVAIITNIGEAHLQELGSRENIAKAKFEITEGLSKDGILIYPNEEVLLSDPVASLSSNIQPLTFGSSTESKIFPSLLKESLHGTDFRVNDSRVEFHLPFPGVHQVQNSLAAILAARSFGMSDEEINEGLAHLERTGMRMEIVAGKNGALLINDVYNASPTSMKAAITYLVGVEERGKKIAVLGDMYELGAHEIAYHKDIGRMIDFSKIDVLYTLGTLGARIAEGAREQGPSDRIAAFENKSDLAQALQLHLDSDTIILFKASRGMKMEEVLVLLVDENRKN